MTLGARGLARLANPQYRNKSFFTDTSIVKEKRVYWTLAPVSWLWSCSWVACETVVVGKRPYVAGAACLKADMGVEGK